MFSERLRIGDVVVDVDYTKVKNDIQINKLVGYYEDGKVEMTDEDLSYVAKDANFYDGILVELNKLKEDT